MRRAIQLGKAELHLTTRTMRTAKLPSKKNGRVCFSQRHFQRPESQIIHYSTFDLQNGSAGRPTAQNFRMYSIPVEKYPGRTFGMQNLPIEVVWTLLLLDYLSHCDIGLSFGQLELKNQSPLSVGINSLVLRFSGLGPRTSSAYYIITRVRPGGTEESSSSDYCSSQDRRD